MNEKRFAPTPQDLRIGISLALCVLLCQLVPAIQTLAACTAAIMCAQDGGKPSWKASLTRLLGVICGGAAGIVVALLHQAIPGALVFALLTGIGVLGDFLLCRLAKLPYIAARVSAISFVLVVLLGGAPYALNRLIGTLCGGVIAVAVAAAWDGIRKPSRQDAEK